MSRRQDERGLRSAPSCCGITAQAARRHSHGGWRRGWTTCAGAWRMTDEKEGGEPSPGAWAWSVFLVTSRVFETVGYGEIHRDTADTAGYSY